MPNAPASPSAAPDQPVWLSGRQGDWRLSLWIQPGAARSGVAGEHDGCLKLRIAAPPIDGRANDEVCAFLSRQLDLPRSAIRIEQGASSRRKRIRIGAEAPLSQLLACLMVVGQHTAD